MRFFYDNLIDGVTISTSNVASEEAQFPRTNIQNAHRGQQWRTTADGGISDEYVVIGSTGGAAARACLVLNHDLLAADTIKFQGNATDSWGSPTLDETMTHSSGVMSELFASATHNYWRLNWTKNVAATAYNIGRLFVGDYHDTERGPDYAGLKSTRRDRSQAIESRGGTVYTLDRHANSPRRWSLDFPSITETQKDSFETILDTVGTHKPFFFQIDPNGSGELSEIIYGRFTTLPSFDVSGFDSELYRDTVLQIEEAL